MRKIAMTDIHGCSLTFKALLEQTGLTRADELYLLGDYIDRGPDSRSVLDTIFKLKKEGYQVHCLSGNHEENFLSADKDPETFQFWTESWGGRETLRSFGATHTAQVPPEYRQFLEKLPFLMEVDEYILVHAGLDFRSPNFLEPNRKMLYIRNWYDTIDYVRLSDRIILHGHTPTQKHIIEKMCNAMEVDRALSLDAGCYTEAYPGMGYLCAFDMTNRRLFFQKRLDDMSGFWKKG